MATLLSFESTGEGGGQGYAYWNGQPSVSGPHVFTGTALTTATEPEYAGGAGGQASNSYIGANGADGLVRLRWPLNAAGSVETVPSSGPIKFSEIGRLGRTASTGSISLGNYYQGSAFLPTGWVAGGTPPARFLGDGVTPAPKAISAYRDLYIDTSLTTPSESLTSFNLPAYVRYVAIRLVGGSGGGGGGDLTIVAGNGGAGLSVDGVCDFDDFDFSLVKNAGYRVGAAGQGGVKSTGTGIAEPGGNGYYSGGNGGTAGTTGSSGTGGSGGGASGVIFVPVFPPGSNPVLSERVFVAGGGGGGGGAGRLYNSTTKDGNAISITSGLGGTLTTNESLLINGTAGNNYGESDGGGCGGGGGAGGTGGIYTPPDPGYEGGDP